MFRSKGSQNQERCQLNNCSVESMGITWEICTKKLASYLHRAATTEHPCCIPALGDSSGAGRIRLARAANVRRFGEFLTVLEKKSLYK